MILADFASPWLLLGLLAAAIPIALHLLSSVKAPEVFFPTLRFLRTSMEKTARRRRLEHWLLLLLRSALLALLALAVAEPILRAASGFSAERRYAAVIIVDNSYSMGASGGAMTRFAAAKAEAAKLLTGPARPSQAGLILTNSPHADADVHNDLDEPLNRLTAANLSAGRADIAACVAQAAKLLEGIAAPQKAIFVFSDLQRLSLTGLPALPDLRAAGIGLMMVDCAAKKPVNVGISDLRVNGYRVTNWAIEFSATLVNSSPTPRSAEVWLQVDDRARGESAHLTLPAAGEPGATATVNFSHRFTTPGTHTGAVVIGDADDLAIDNTRRFSLEIAPKVKAVLVRNSAYKPGDVFDPARWVQLALDPHRDPNANWPVQLTSIPAEQFGEQALAGIQVAVFADVPTFTDGAAKALKDFVKAGGTAVLFLGPGTNVDNYNQRLGGSDALLPGKLEQAVGQVGVAADAVRANKNLQHPYLINIHKNPSDYPVLVYRYYRMSGQTPGAESVLSTPSGDAVVSAATVGLGRAILCTTTASAEWNNIGATPILLSMLTRMCLEAGNRASGDCTYPVGAEVTIRPHIPLPEKSAVNITSPDGKVEAMPLAATPPGGPAAIFTRTQDAGVYKWQVIGLGPEVEGGRGEFVTNPDGAECELTPAEPDAIRAAVKGADVYFGKNLDEVNAAAATAAAGDNLWDRLVVIVILLLVIEAVVANRFRKGAEPVPVHLNPRLAR
jgi:hypothetical protein